MFIQIDHQTKQETVISSEAMVAVLEADMQASFIDDSLTEMVLGTYTHRNRQASYTYRTK